MNTSVLVVLLLTQTDRYSNINLQFLNSVWVLSQINGMNDVINLYISQVVWIRYQLVYTYFRRSSKVRLNNADIYHRTLIDCALQ